jgi:hypothetical protein
MPEPAWGTAVPSSRSRQGDDRNGQTTGKERDMCADRRDLRQVPREIRPDWDLGMSRLREAGEVGDRSSFSQDEDLDPSPRAVQV